MLEAQPRTTRPLDILRRLVHDHLLALLIAVYASAALWPGLGLAIRDFSFGRVTLGNESMRLSAPTLMLGFLLMNAGLGVRLAELRRLFARPRLLVIGLVANLAIPIAFIAVVSQALGVWHNPDEVQNILVGLALVASMPIAGSSTAWAQNADGDLPLSLGLVVGSTLLSPFTTPVALHAVGWLAEGTYAADLHALAENGTGIFLLVCVIAPSVLGMGLRAVVGEAGYARAKPWLKLAATADLLILCYSNAAISLPQAIAKPDGDFLAAILAIASSLCLLAFGSGWVIARVLGVEGPRRAALMFGLGMNNNGTGLVLASMTLAGYPRVMLPIIIYNLVQQVVAGLAGRFLRVGPGSGRPVPHEAALPAHRSGQMLEPQPVC